MKSYLVLKNGGDKNSEDSSTDFMYLRDQPIASKDLDRFEYSPFVDVLRDIIKNSKGPLNIGLFGPWGAGKSSILSLLEEALKNENEAELIIIDAWKISSQHLREEFLIEMNNRFEVFDKENFLRDLVSSKEEEQLEQHKESWPNIVKKLIPSIVVFSISAILVLIDKLGQSKPENSSAVTDIIPLTVVVGFFLAILPNLKSITEEFKSLRTTLARGTRTTFPRVELSQQFQNIFLELLDKILDKKKSLVIAIDNLDRCESEVVIEMLSMIKTFMGNIEKCKYIIACDNNAIESHLANIRNFTPLDSIVTPREFLQKFFQITMRVPPFIPGDLTEYADSLLSGTPMKEQEGISEILNLGVLKNPRKIHQYINNLVLFYNVAKIKEQNGAIQRETITKNVRFLAKLIVLREEYPEFYRYVERDPTLLDDVEKYLRGVTKSDVLPERLQVLLQEDPYLNYFLWMTLNVTSKDMQAFLNLKQEKFESDLPDRLNFIERIISNDVEYLSHRLNKKNSLSEKYFLELIHYMKRLFYSRKPILATQCVNLLIENIDNAPEVLKNEILHNLERSLQGEQILESLGKFDVEKVFRLLETFHYNGRNTVLDKYAQTLVALDVFNERLLQMFTKNADLISDTTINIMNEIIASWITAKTEYGSILEILSMNSVTRKKFIRSPVLQSLVSKIVTNNPTFARRDTDLYIQYKDLATQPVRHSFLDKMNTMLRTSDADDVMAKNYGNPVTDFQAIAISSILRLAPEDMETEISNSICETIDSIKSNVDGVFANRSPKPGIDFYVNLMRVKLVVFNKVDLTRQKRIVGELKDLIENGHKFTEIVEYAKMYKSNILEHDEILKCVVESIEFAPNNPQGFDFLIECSSLERKDKIVQILREWIVSREPSGIEGLLLSLKMNHAMIPKNGRDLLKEALGEKIEKTFPNANSLLKQVFDLL